MRWRAERGGGAALLAALLLAGCGGGVHRLVADAPVRIGRPYAAAGRIFVPADDPGYDRIGEASWYGAREQGRPTASGERFDRRRVSAAHPTLPLPSYVEVTRLDSGARMIVRINDRGPFARDRILDLSREAARGLGMDRAGRALVRVRRVTPSPGQARALRRGYPVMLASVPPTASPPGVGPAVPALSARSRTPAPPARPAGGDEIVVATLADPDAADALATTLADEGARVAATGGGYRIVVGPYRDAAAHSDALARLAARGYQGAEALDAAPATASGTPNP